jgi:hypothetical protein
MLACPHLTCVNLGYRHGLCVELLVGFGVLLVFEVVEFAFEVIVTL